MSPVFLRSCEGLTFHWTRSVGIRRQDGRAPRFLGAGILNQPLHPGSSETHVGKLPNHSAQGPATRNSKDASWEQIFFKIPQMTLKEARVENHWCSHTPDMPTKPRGILKRKRSWKL